MIESGEYKPGDKLPRESEMAMMMNVSRTPLREALQMLEQQGYITRRQGKGTFVRPKHFLAAGLECLDAMTDVVKSHGYTPGTRHTEITLERASEHIARALEIGAGDPVHVIRRVRTANEVPFSWGWMAIPVALLKAAPALAETQWSITKYLEERGLKISCAQAVITTELSGRRASRHLEVSTGTPLLVLEQVHYRADRLPVALSRTHFRPDMVTFRVLRSRRCI